MDVSISRVLEMGLAFILFVWGLSVFILLNDGMVSLTQGEFIHREEMQVTMLEGALSVDKTSVEEIYLILTDDAFMNQDNWLGETGYIASSGRVAIYVDGIQYTPVSDLKGRQILGMDLSSLPSTTFEKYYHCDDEGLLTELHFISR